MLLALVRPPPHLACVCPSNIDLASVFLFLAGNPDGAVGLEVVGRGGLITISNLRISNVAALDHFQQRPNVRKTREACQRFHFFFRHHAHWVFLKWLLRASGVFNNIFFCL